MTASTFDTHAAVIALRNAGIEERHAEAIVNTVRESASADRGELATKADLRAEVAGLATKGELYRALLLLALGLVGSQVAIAAVIVSMVGQMLGALGQ